jgi:hypothetical protein
MMSQIMREQYPLQITLFSKVESDLVQFFLQNVTGFLMQILLGISITFGAE